MTERQDASGHQALRNGAAWNALQTIREAVEGYLPYGAILPAGDVSPSLTAEAAELVRGVHQIGRLLAESYAAGAPVRDALLRPVPGAANDARDRLWQIIADIMLVAQFDGVITDANQAWANTLGWSKRELVGRNLFDFIHPDDLHRTRTAARSLSAQRWQLPFNHVGGGSGRRPHARSGA